MKIVRLEGLLEKFSKRVSKLPAEFQAVFLEDLKTAVEHRMKVSESATRFRGHACE